MPTLKFYRHPLSGNSHRVEVFLSLLGLNSEVIDVDLMAGAQRQPEFLALNPLGQVPVLVDGDTVLSDSNAILVYLAQKYDAQHKWLPEEPALAAEVHRFLSIASNEVSNGPAAARLVTLFGAKLDHQNTIDNAHKLLHFLEQHLSNRKWLATDRPTIADVSVYAYVAHAPEGGVALQDYPAVRDWLTRFEALPDFIPMQTSAVGLAA